MVWMANSQKIASQFFLAPVPPPPRDNLTIEYVVVLPLSKFEEEEFSSEQKTAV